MGIVKGLSGMTKAMDKVTYTSSEDSKAKWLKIEDGEAFNYYFVLADKLNTNPPALSASIITIEHTTKKNPYSVNVEL